MSTEQIILDGFESAERRKPVKRDESYEAFVDKFKPKLTTDDCYTPPEVYEAVKSWAVKELGWEGRPIVRPFFPGGDYEAYSYPEGCVVIDNPPFSILSQIVRFYEDCGIDYLLFAPALTCLGIPSRSHICAGCKIVYHNGAVVTTSFVSSQGVAIRTAPALTAEVNAVSAALKSETVRHVPQYIYPPGILTAAEVHKWSERGIDYREDRVHFIRALDSQRRADKALFGGGFLVPRPEAERAKLEAERAKLEAERAKKKIAWSYSPDELAILAQLEAMPKNWGGGG